MESEGCMWDGRWGLDSHASRGQGHLAEVKLLQATAFSVSLVNQGNRLFTSRSWLLFNTLSLQGHQGNRVGGENNPRWWGGSVGTACGRSSGLQG